MKVSGRTIELDGDELARAIDVYLLAQDVAIDGPRTVRVATVGGLRVVAGKVSVSVYVDPDGRVIREGRLVIDREREGRAAEQAVRAGGEHDDLPMWHLLPWLRPAKKTRRKGTDRAPMRK